MAKIPLLAAGLAAAVAFWLLSKGKGEAAPPTGAPATPQGIIGGVEVQQWSASMGGRRGRAIMGSHLVAKGMGSQVNGTVQWTAGTRNSQGQPIAWNYAISYRYLHPVSGALRSGGFLRIGSRANGTYLFTFSNVLDSTFPAGDWTVQVSLHADRSSPTGAPLGDAVNDDALLIGSAQHVGAFRIAASAPSDAQIIQRAQELAGSTPSPDKGFFVGHALLSFNMLRSNYPDGEREMLRDMGFPSFSTWALAMSWWHTLTSPMDVAGFWTTFTIDF